MRHRKTACFEALVLEPHFAQSCGRFLLLYSLGGRVRCKHPFIGRCKMWNCQFVQHLRAAYVQTVEQQWSNLLSGPVKQGNKVSLWGHSENRGEDAGVPRAPFKQCWFVREGKQSIQGFLFLRASSTLPSWGQRGARQKPTEFAKEKRERKAPQPKARTESEEAGRERYGQGTLPSWTKTTDS